MNVLSWWMVVLLGMGIVFVGLSLLVLLCNVLRLLFSKVEAKPEAQPVLAPAVAAPAVEALPDRKRLLAIAAAAIAESEGSEASGFRIVSFTRRKNS